MYLYLLPSANVTVWTIRVRIQAEDETASSSKHPDWLWAVPSSCWTGTGVISQGKAAPPCSDDVKNDRMYTLLLVCISCYVNGQLCVMKLHGICSPRWTRIFINTSMRNSNIALLGYIVRKTDAIGKLKDFRTYQHLRNDRIYNSSDPPTHQLLLLKILLNASNKITHSF